jgi:hypothetical protein
VMKHATPLYLLLLLLVSTVSATEVSGTISTTTWTSVGSPYRVSGEAVVPPGETLTIEAGVDVLFDADVPFQVEGALHVAGTKADSVRFMPGTAPSWGGLRISSGDSSSLRYCTVTGVFATDAGGVAVSDGATILLINCVLADNSTDQSGGGIALFDSVAAHIESCSIRNNSSGWGGGGIYAYPGVQLRVYATEIVENTSDGSGSGAALFVADERLPEWSPKGPHPSVIFDQCTITRNVATGEWNPTGGTVYIVMNADPQVMILNCTITDNTGPKAGIKVHLSILHRVSKTLSDSLHLLINNSIVWGNDSPYNVWTGSNTLRYRIEYSNIEGGSLFEYAGTGIIDTDPLFADAENDDYRLLEDSPCIDSGDPTLTDPDDSRSDMGATVGPYEHPVAVQETSRPVAFRLHPATPNPFNPSTTIRYTLPESGNATLSIWSVDGRRVRTLVDGHVTAGTHSVAWDGMDATGRAAASGVYVVRLTTRTRTVVQAVTLVR